MIISIEKNKTSIYYVDGDSLPLDDVEYHIEHQEHFLKNEEVKRVEVQILFAHERKLNINTHTNIRFDCGCIHYDLTVSSVDINFDVANKQYTYVVRAHHYWKMEKTNGQAKFHATLPSIN